MEVLTEDFYKRLITEEPQSLDAPAGSISIQSSVEKQNQMSHFMEVAT